MPLSLPLARRAARGVLILPLAAGVLSWLAVPVAVGVWERWAALWGWGAWPLAWLLAWLSVRPPRPSWWEQVDPLFLLGLETVGVGLLTAASLRHPAGDGHYGAGGFVGDAVVRFWQGQLGIPGWVGALLLVAGGVGLMYLYRPWDVDSAALWAWWLWVRAHAGPWLGWHLPATPRTADRSWFERVRRWLRGILPGHRAPTTEEAPKQEVAVTAGTSLPPLSLLAQDDSYTTDENELKRQARLIRETLASFGIPVRVVEVHQGPAVTQFCVQPLMVKRGGKKRRISVRRILAVQNDLALMLAAAPIRIEAPVPGKPYVGIEVPNTHIKVVRLGGVMASPEFQRVRSPLALALGRDVMGAAVVSDLIKLPHLLIAGTTGSGKSVAINSMIVSWLMRNTPQDLRLILVDPKRVELTTYSGIPHLIGPVVTEVDEVLKALTWALLEMDERYRRFAKARVRSLAKYNAWALRHQLSPLPYIVIVIDELADIMLAHGQEVEFALTRLAQMARATGIHLVVATQRPSVDVITGLIKANFPARLAFAVTSQVDSRVILDMPGAEALLGRGDGLFLPPDRPHPIRLQGSFVSDEEIARVVHWWREHAEEAPPAEAPWAHLPIQEEEDLLQRAIALVRREQRVSASFLQRKLHVGFKRAQELITELERMGIVGPDEGGGRGRRVLVHDDTFPEKAP